MALVFRKPTVVEIVMVFSAKKLAKLGYNIIVMKLKSFIEFENFSTVYLLNLT